MRTPEHLPQKPSVQSLRVLNPAVGSIVQISAEQFEDLSEEIAFKNKSQSEGRSVFQKYTCASSDYKHQPDEFYLVEQSNGDSVIFSVSTKNFRVPFLGFVRPLLVAKLKTEILCLVQEIHFTAGSNLEHAAALLVSHLTNTSGKLPERDEQAPKEPVVAFSFSANCPQLAIALENIKGLCLHFSQNPSTSTECSSLSDFVFSFILNANGFDQDLCYQYSVASIISGLKLDRQFDYDYAKLEHFYSLELERSKKIWEHPDTPAYLGKTREELNIVSPDHRHLEVGSGFFPDYLLLQKQLAPNGSITIFEREKQILDRLRSEHEMSPGYSNLRFMPAIDILETQNPRQHGTFDSIRVVDFFEFMTDEKLAIFCTHLYNFLKPGGRLVIAEKNLARLEVSDSNIDADCELLRTLYALNTDSAAGGTLEQAFVNAGFHLLANHTTLNRTLNGQDLATFLSWTRLDNFHAYVKSVLSTEADSISYSFDIQQLVFTKV